MKKITIIDDSMLIRVYVKVNLEKLSYQVTQFEDAVTAIRSLRKKEDVPDLILVDVNMPKMNGYAFCKILKEEPDLSKIPVVIITSLNSDWDKDHAQKCGANGFITKPFPIELLREKIESFTENNKPVQNTTPFKIPDF